MLVWTMFVAYLLAIAALAALGRRRARRDPRSFAIGRVHPLVAGMTMAASLASTATFVINPGFVYVHGISALLHFGVAAVAGMITGLWLVCGRFRRLGAASGAVTLPQWIGARYGSRGLRVLFAIINLFNLAFVVLIVGGLSIVMQTTLHVGNTASVLFMIGFVFWYVFAGGAYAHAYTNTLQAAIKAVVAVMIFVSGVHFLGSGALEHLRAADPNLVAPVNPASPLFGSWFSVAVAGFVIGFALMCQPHIMTTTLYVEDDRGVRRALVVATILSIVFASVLLAGIYARLALAPGDVPSQDRVMTTYLAHTFSPAALALVTVALLAAGMSAMSAILVSLSSMAGNDLVGGSIDRARKASRIILIAFGAVVLLIALHPPKLLGIFGQLGAYGVVAAAAAPVVLGVLVPGFGRRGATAAALLGPSTHFVLYFAVGMPNPGVTATIGILVSFGAALASLLLARLWHPVRDAGADLHRVVAVQGVRRRPAALGTDAHGALRGLPDRQLDPAGADRDLPALRRGAQGQRDHG